jgi:hypothetical protein
METMQKAGSGFQRKVGIYGKWNFNRLALLLGYLTGQIGMQVIDSEIFDKIVYGRMHFRTRV